MIYTGLITLFQVNFPKSQAGSSDVYYTIYNGDGTVYQARTKTDVDELGEGAYGILLQFADVGNWSIHWDIDSTSYVANEEINVQDPNVTYVGVGE